MSLKSASCLLTEISISFVEIISSSNELKISSEKHSSALGSSVKSVSAVSSESIVRSRLSACRRGMQEPFIFFGASIKSSGPGANGSNLLSAGVLQIGDRSLSLDEDSLASVLWKCATETEHLPASFNGGISSLQTLLFSRQEALPELFSSTKHTSSKQQDTTCQSVKINFGNYDDIQSSTRLVTQHNRENI
ncbi:hypothetical protein M5K25_013664 [Dendrobium thyrsiflorum]|uniref:Uncharacterized protein n=1 Tax=Dendrobium thyrsiflorum TaxID=117978 RepID=A0ABD0UTK3_DENTH